MSTLLYSLAVNLIGHQVLVPIEVKARWSTLWGNEVGSKQSPPDSIDLSSRWSPIVDIIQFQNYMGKGSRTAAKRHAFNTPVILYRLAFHLRCIGPPVVLDFSLQTSDR